MPNPEQDKLAQLTWLGQVYSHHQDAIREDVAETHLFETFEGFGIDQFVATYTPLIKYREAHAQDGQLQFDLGKIEHEAPDLTFAELLHNGECAFVLRVRFEEESPCRIKYWISYPPLPSNIELRRYEAKYAPGCVALEQACPMEMKDGSSWVIDRGRYFDDYLQLMAPLDAIVAIETNANSPLERVVGFYSNALRPIRHNKTDTFAVYQHHYRVHPDYRAGTISMA